MYTDRAAGKGEMCFCKIIDSKVVCFYDYPESPVMVLTVTGLFLAVTRFFDALLKFSQIFKNSVNLPKNTVSILCIFLENSRKIRKITQNRKENKENIYCKLYKKLKEIYVNIAIDNKWKALYNIFYK